MDQTQQNLGQCILCAKRSVEEFLDLGSTALANQFLRPEEVNGHEAKYPLRVGFCHSCGHVQLLDRVPPLEMFENYLYISSASDTLKNHFRQLSGDLVRRYRLCPGDLVIDIGCNDGTLLEAFKAHGVRVLGVDPALNLADFAVQSGIERCTDLFTLSTAKEIVRRWGRASLVTATNTFPHIQLLDDFVQGIDAVLKPGGAFVIEAHYLRDMVEQLAFDTIYHEHVSYWALGPMKRLFERHAMSIVHAERIPLHHGQLRAHVQRRGEGAVQPSVGTLLAEEKTAGLDRIDTYTRFSDQARKIKAALHTALASLASQGRKVAGYGAPAKGNTLLGFLEIGPELLPYIVDRSPLKQGRVTPGTHIPVVPTEQLLEDQPDYLLLLAWNFVDEIIEQQAEYRKRGGKFMLPVPEVRIL